MVRRISQYLALAGIAGACNPLWALAEDSMPVLGRWDLTIQGLDFPAFGWLEVQQSGDRTLVGKFVGWWGSARPVARIEFTNDVLRFSIPPQWERGDADLRVEGKMRDGELTGTMIDPNGTPLRWTGRRAPILHRSAAVHWMTPIVLFDGKNISAWQVQPNSQWQVIGGVLTNVKAGGNLVTRDSFADFKLHVEFRYPTDGNSGVYLRGRYEVQIEDSPSFRVRTEGLASIYGFLPPSVDASKGPGQWQSYDVKLIGRLVTVVLNGTTVISNQEIPGITGGALSGDEGSPGPIMLQGDHGLMEFRNIVLTPAK